MHTNPDLLALLALGEAAGDQDERAHLDSCTLCRSELAELTHTVDLGRRSGPDSGLLSPAPAVWTSIRTELGFIGPDEATPTAPPRSTAEAVRLPVRRLTRSTVALVAGLALIAGLGIGLGADRLFGDREAVVSRAALTALPGWDGASGEAWVEQDGDGNRRLVVSVDSRRIEGHARQVWMIDRQVAGMSSMGYLSDGRGVFTIPDNLDIGAYPIVDVSVEPPDDRDPRHSGESIVRGTLTPA